MTPTASGGVAMSVTLKRKRPQKQPQEMKKPTYSRGLKAYFRRHSLDMRAPCTDADSPTSMRQLCWLVRKIGVWNSFLENIGLELRENRPGRLSLYTFARCDPSMNDYGSVCVTLLAELLATHRCIYFVHFGYAGKLFSMKMSVIQHLTPNSSIEQFHVDGQAMDSDEMYTFIRAMWRAKPLSVQVCNRPLRRCDVHSMSIYVEVTSTLRELALVDTGFKVSDTILLFKALEKSKSIEYLRLEVNTVGIRGAKQFAALLRRNTILRLVTLQRVKLQANGAVAIAAALAENTTLVSLRIASNSIGPVGARALAETLKTNSSLSVLDLRDNAIGTSGAVAFATTLKVNSKLEELHVCGNAISEEGIVAIAEAVMDNKSLKVLSLFANGFSDEGVAALGRLIACNRTLVRLNATLESSYGAPRMHLDAFAEALAANTAIRGVQLFVWGTPAMKQLSHMLPLTQTLQYLCVCTCGPEIEQLCAALAQNKSIQEVEINCYLNLDDGAALAHLFETTTTIQAVTITKRVKNTCLVRLFNGIAMNSSIWWFSVQGGRLTSPACTAIAGALESNNTLACMTLGRATAEDSCLELVSAALERNCTLQMMSMNYSATSLPALKIRQRLRCNMGMMMQAIEFALTRNVSKALAEAFEMYKDTPFFLQELAKSNGNQGRPGASALIKEGERFIEENYFQITGVVKRAIVCARRTRKKKNTTMFDNLNNYCLRDLLSYLRVSDVQR
ncbi:hypothetical protein HPB51_006829 [Rhipicephalus microplus]|uniref:Uncharacterized protein n=1 Tax=Rhipicephalus microplus TaxID=6941 RepID=A0A9J6E8I0_RHIMP|nr:hypothetical protein HPB51_006829 [Rhipicephalus microplus]